MMLEVDCYKLRRQTEDVLEESISVAPGGLGFVSFLRNIRLMVQCEKGSKSGNVIIAGNNPRLRLSITRYQNDCDEKGNSICPENFNSPIWLEGEQFLVFSTRKQPFTKLFDRKVLIYFGSDDDSENLSVGAPDPTRDLVLV